MGAPIVYTAWQLTLHRLLDFSKEPADNTDKGTLEPEMACAHDALTQRVRNQSKHWIFALQSECGTPYKILLII